MGSINMSLYLLVSVIILGVHTASVEIPQDNVNTNNKQALVETTDGWVQGELYGKNWYRFRGIPFAEPPVGNLRFEPPVPIKPWKGVLDATKKGEICIQGKDHVEGSEDCLFVKIYTPQAPQPKNKLPVLVYIYGGAFFGGAPDFDGAKPDLLLQEGDSVIPGNAGLRDQILALQWIRKNIRNFGGDPEKITLFGQSAGSASISYLLQAPQTKGLYSGAIMLSGSSLDSWALTRNPLNFAKSVASSLNIKTNNVKEMVNGLKKHSAQEIQKAASTRFIRSLALDPLVGLPLGPVIEPNHANAVITGKSYEILKAGHFNNVPIIMGHTSLEAHSNDGLSLAIKVLLTKYSLNPGSIVPIAMNLKPITRLVIGKQIKYQYFGNSPMTTKDIKALTWISEDQFVRGIHEAVRLYSRKNPVYYYNFAHEGKLYKEEDRTIPGVGHTEDLGYVFDYGRKGSNSDYLVRDKYVRLITNFAKFRNPTPQTDKLLDNIHWPANRCSNNNGCDVKQLNIKEKLTIETNPYKKNMDFWKTLFESKGTPPFDTY